MPFRCTACGTTVPDATAVCETCGGFVRYAAEGADALQAAVAGDPWAGLPAYEPRISMGEGDTPTIELDCLDVGTTVYGKLESLNPTCSFKDRGSALTVSAAADDATSWEALVVASTGNTAPSIAAYAARAEVPCAVLVPQGTSASKLSQVAAHGADVYAVDGTFSDCFQFAQRASDDRVLNATAVYSANSFVASANRTVAFEVAAHFETVPDWIAVPVGAGPLLGGVQAGFAELAAAGIVDAQPKMLCVQARGCHPIVRAVEAGEPVRPWTDPITTDVDAIADPLVGYAADGEATRQAVLESEGTAVALTDQTIHAWTERLARREGIYAEPAAVAGVAAAEAVADADETVLALITGHGLKESADDALEPERVDEPATLRDTLL